MVKAGSQNGCIPLVTSPFEDLIPDDLAPTRNTSPGMPRKCFVDRSESRSGRPAPGRRAAWNEYRDPTPGPQSFVPSHDGCVSRLQTDSLVRARMSSTIAADSGVTFVIF